MKRVGLTGGIGSGKTTVAKIFQSLGVPVYNSDNRAKQIMEFDQDLISAIKRTFGDSIYAEGQLDRRALATIVFQNKHELKKLNALVHPAVRNDFTAWSEGFGVDTDYILKEAAILFESGGYKELDAVIVVSAPEELRLSRVMSRDAVDEESVKARMGQQWSEEDRLDLADYVILNDGSLSLIEQVMELHQVLNKGYMEN